MRRSYVFLVFALSAFAIQAQSPPPALLPKSITGEPKPMAVIPASATATAAPPIARFQDLQNLPPETAATVRSMRSAAEWLVRAQQPHGRFLFGVNPALRSPLEGDSPVRQALATWGMCQAAKFTGEEKVIACGAQALLSLAVEPAADTPAATVLAYLAIRTLAIHAQPNRDAKLTALADQSAVKLAKAIQDDGSIDLSTANAEWSQLLPGLILEALSVQNTASDAAIDERILKAFVFHRTKFQSKPHSLMAGTLVPAAVEYVMRTKNQAVAAIAFEMTDWLCTQQYSKLDGQQLFWSGAFPTDPSSLREPGFESAHATRALAAACQLIRKCAPDLTRYQKYRPALIEALTFLRGLQFSTDNTTHFTPEFRNQYLLGGIRIALTDGNVRADATALSLLAFHRYLESGSEIP